MSEPKKPPEPKSAVDHVMEAWERNQDQVLENLLRDHPQLTQEQAVEALKESGFY